MNSVAPSENALPQPVQKWLSNGQSLHAELRNELKVLEAHLAALKARVQQKRAQVEQIAQVLGRVHNTRPSVEPAAPAAGIDDALRIRLASGRPATAGVRRSGPDDAVMVPFRQ